jgi:hypothetical protein
MPAWGLRTKADNRFRELAGIEPAADDDDDEREQRRAELLRLVRADEAENAEFYRKLGNR